MRMRKSISRLLAIVCVITLLFNSSGLSAYVGASGTEDLFAGYEVLTATDFGITEDYTHTGPKKEFIFDGDLDGKVIDMTYILSGAGTVNFGTRDGGFILERTGSDQLRYYYYDYGTKYYKDITSADTGCALFDAELPVKAAFKFANKNAEAGTTDVTFTVKIGNYMDVFTVENAHMNMLRQIMAVYAVDDGSYTNSSVTIKAEDFFAGYEVLTATDFGIKEDYTHTGTKKEFIFDGDLDGKMIDMTYILSGAGTVNFGTRDGGFILERTGSDKLRYYYYDGGTKYYKDITSADAGCSLFDSELPVKAAFKFANKNAEAGTADVTFTVKIGNYMDVFTVENAHMGMLRQIMAVYAVDYDGYTDSSVTIKAEDFFAGYEVLTAEEFGITEDYIHTGEIKEFIEDGGLDGKVIDMTYIFSGNAHVNFGIREGGFIIERRGDYADIIRYYYYEGGTKYYKDLTPEDTGCALFDAELPVKVAFKTANKNETAGTADVTFTVKIGEWLDKFTVEGASMGMLKRTMSLRAVDEGGLTNSSITVKAVESGEPEEPVDPFADYEVLTAEDFGITEDYIHTGEIKEFIEDDGLDGKVIDMTYIFSGNAHVNFGIREGGFIIERRGDYADIIRYYYYEGGTKYYKDLTPEDTGCALFDAELPVKVAFKTANKNETAGTADVTFTVKIGEWLDKFTVEGASMGMLNRIMSLRAVDEGGLTNSSVTVKVGGSEEPEEPEEPDDPFADYEVLTAEDFGITEDYIHIGTKFEIVKDGDYDGKMIDMTYIFSGAGTVNFGAREGGLVLERMNANTLRYYYYDGGTKYYKDLTSADTGCELFGEELPVKAAFKFENRNEEAGTADVTFTVQIGEWLDKFTVEGAHLNMLRRIMAFYAVDYGDYTDSSVTVKVGGSNEPEEPDDSFGAGYDILTAEDFGITEDYTHIGPKLEFIRDGKLDGKMIDMTYILSGNFIVNFGTREGGFTLERRDASTLRYYYYDGGTKYYKDLTSADAGCALFDAELPVKVGFKFANKNEAAGTADVSFKVKIGKWEDEFTVEGAHTKMLNRIMGLWAVDGESGYTNSSVTVKAAKAEEPGEVPSINDTFTKLGFSSFGIVPGTYRYNKRALSVSGKSDLTSMDGVIFSDTVNFSDEKGVELCIAGLEDAWHGLVLFNDGKGILKLKSAVGNPFPPFVFESNIAGTELTGQDVQLTMSFEYVDSDGDGAKDDIKLGIWFDGKPYKDRWFFIRDYAPKLGSYMGIYVDNEQASLSVKTYMEPVDFEEFGFTKNWAFELGLLKRSGQVLQKIVFMPVRRKKCFNKQTLQGTQRKAGALYLRLWQR